MLSSKHVLKPVEPLASPSTNVSGRWDVDIRYAAGTATHMLHLQQDGNRLDGIHRGDFLTRDISGTISGDRVTLASIVTERHGDALTYRFTGTVNGSSISGSLDLGEYLAATWTARKSRPPHRRCGFRLSACAKARVSGRISSKAVEMPEEDRWHERRAHGVSSWRPRRSWRWPPRPPRRRAGAQAAQKKVYRKLTPTSMTVKGQPLYSPELSFGNLVFVSGKGAGVKATGDIEAQTKTVLDQIEESLKLAGSSMDKVLKVNVYLTDIKNFEGMNRSYINRFGSDPPVRTTVAVTALPDGSLVEIDCIAHL